MNIPLHKVYMNECVNDYVYEVLNSGYIGQGKEVERFEKSLCKYLGVTNLVAVNSATSGIHLVLNAIKDHRKSVISTPLTCIATNAGIVHNGLDIVWADVDPTSCNIDITDIAKKITIDTLAIIVVHWGGNPVDIYKLKQVVESFEEKFGHKIHIIEDCAHAFGAEYHERKIGTHGNICVYSFQATKPLTCGDGGAIVCNDENLFKKINLLKWYGIDRNFNSYEQDIKDVGFKFHMNNISAAIGSANMAYVEDRVNLARRNADFYRKNLFDGSESIKPIKITNNSYPSYWLYTCFVEDREKFIQIMESHKIEVGPVHKRNDELSCFSQYKTDLPQLDSIYNKIVCIPAGYWVSENERHKIFEAITKYKNTKYVN